MIHKEKIIEEPLCENCGAPKSLIIGREKIIWICMGRCNGGYEAQFIYRPPNEVD